MFSGDSRNVVRSDGEKIETPVTKGICKTMETETINVNMFQTEHDSIQTLTIYQ